MNASVRNVRASPESSQTGFFLHEKSLIFCNWGFLHDKIAESVAEANLWKEGKSFLMLFQTYIGKKGFALDSSLHSSLTEKYTYLDVILIWPPSYSDKEVKL